MAAITPVQWPDIRWVSALDKLNLSLEEAKVLVRDDIAHFYNIKLVGAKALDNLVRYMYGEDAISERTASEYLKRLDELGMWGKPVGKEQERWEQLAAEGKLLKPYR